MNTYNLSEAAKMIDIKNLGRQKLYKILKESGVVDNYNRPVQKCINDGYFDTKLPTINIYGFDMPTPVTIVNGQLGLDFLKEIVTTYLQENPMPTFPRKKRDCGTNI